MRLPLLRLTFWQKLAVIAAVLVLGVVGALITPPVVTHRGFRPRAGPSRS